MTLSSSLEHLPNDPLLEVAGRSLHRFRNFIETKEQLVNQIPNFSSQAFIVATSTAVSGTIVSRDNNLSIYKVWELGGLPLPTTWTPDRHRDYANRLSKLDVELGKTYRAVWETFQGTTDSSERSSLFAMRQVFDHFFRFLSPDEEVRKAELFRVKETGNPQQVYRTEKIRYAANKHIKDRSLALTLESQAEHVNELYNRLNKAHSDKPLIHDEVKQILTAMQGVLEEWIDALML